MRVAHYFDHDGIPTTNPVWSVDAAPGSFLINGNLDYGKIYNDFFTTSFSPFTLASATNGNTLPIAILEWDIMQLNRDAILKWQINSQYAVKSCTIQKSNDGTNFYPLVIIPTSQDSILTAQSFRDLHTSPGWNYYRLIIAGNRGDSIVSVIKRIWLDNFTFLKCYPNPSSGLFWIEIPDTPGIVELFDISGQKVYSAICKTRKLLLNVSALPKACYLVKYLNAHVFSSVKITLV